MIQSIKTIYLIVTVFCRISAYSVTGTGFCSFCANRCDFGPNFHHFVIETKTISPDNFQQTAKLINGQFPGPTIRITPYETLVVKVTNLLSHGITLHFHGLHQQRTLSSDGAGKITQDDIPPNGTYTYCMEMDGQMGTHFYHAHTGFDAYWTHGALIIEDFQFLRSLNLLRLSNLQHLNYDEERVILLEHLFHTPADSMLGQVLFTGVTGFGNQSGIINGKSFADWGNGVDSSSCEGYDVIRVKQGRKYRFRVINATPSRVLRFSIANHKMTVVEADGVWVSPVEVESLFLSTAQRYSVLVEMDQQVDNYWIKEESLLARGFGNGAAILHYEGAQDPSTLRKTIRNEGNGVILPLGPADLLKFVPDWNIRQTLVYPVPKEVDRNIYLDFQVFPVPPVERYRMGVEGNIFQEPEVPFLTQVRKERKNITKEPEVFEVISGQVVQIIFQNRVDYEGVPCFPHPWHLHGRYVHIVAYGADEFDEEKDLQLIQESVERGDLVEFRDVFSQFLSQSVVNLTKGAGCGWQAVRFIADNPGIWLNHCHITGHLLQGKAFVIWEHEKRNPWLLGE